MSVTARSIYSLLAAVVLLGLLVGVPVAACGSVWCVAESGDGTGTAKLAAPRPAFALAGDTTKPLAPGTRARVNVSFTNPHPYRLWVSDLEVSVAAVEAPRAGATHPCSLRDFSVRQLPSERTVALAPRSTRTLRSLHVRPSRWPRIIMRDRPVNQDGCKGAVLTLDYSAAGIRDYR